MGQPIPLVEMISLYDTHGIPPEIARESAEEMGALVELPDNFYSLVAKKRIGPRRKRPRSPCPARHSFYSTSIPSIRSSRQWCWM